MLEVKYPLPEQLEPPEPDYEFTVECPNCGAELHEGELIYQKKKKDGSWIVFACEHCIDDFASYVEDL